MKYITLVFILLLLIIIALANQGASNLVFDFVRWLPYGDKIGHFCLMGMFSFLVTLSLSGRQVWVKNRPIILGALLVTIAVTLEEFTQLFMSERTFSLIDLLFDYAGIFIFGRIAFILNKRIEHRFSLKDEHGLNGFDG